MTVPHSIGKPFDSSTHKTCASFVWLFFSSKFQIFSFWQLIMCRISALRLPNQQKVQLMESSLAYLTFATLGIETGIQKYFSTKTLYLFYSYFFSQISKVYMFHQTTCAYLKKIIHIGLTSWNKGLSIVFTI